jgi:hypothetical protein
MDESRRCREKRRKERESDLDVGAFHLNKSTGLEAMGSA